MPSLRALVGAMASCALAIPARAHELREEITVRVDRGWVTTSSRVELEPDEAGSAVLPVRLDGTMATGLWLGAGKRAMASRLFEAPSTDALPAEAPLAALVWGSPEHARLELAELVPGRTLRVKTRTERPMIYRDGRYWVPLDALGYADATLRVTFEVAHAGDLLHLDDAELAVGEPYDWDAEQLAIAEPDHGLWLTPSSSAPFEGELATVDLGDRTLVGLELRAGPQLAEVPFGAQIVVIIDTSRSVAAPVLEGSVAAARAYLDSFVDRGARVQVVTFDREARPLLHGFVPARQAIEALTGAVIEQRNGSALDRAVELAGSLLAARPRGKPRRVVILSDLELPPGTHAATLASAFERGGALVHVGRVVGGYPGLEELDDPAFSAPAEATGGLAWQASVSGDAGHGERMREVFSHWASPRELRALELTGATGLVDPPRSLAYGDGVEPWWITDAPPRRVQASARLWTEPVRIELRAEPALGRRLAVEVLSERGYDLEHAEASEEGPTLDELRALARASGAVTPWTSRRVGAERTGRVPQDPIVALSHVPRLECMLRVDGSARPAGLVRLSFDEDAHLHDAVEDVARRCRVEGAGLEVEVDTTVGEIVGVSAPRFARDVEPAASQCVVEGIWELELPAGHGPSRRHELRWPERPQATRL